MRASYLAGFNSPKAIAHLYRIDLGFPPSWWPVWWRVAAHFLFPVCQAAGYKLRLEWLGFFVSRITGPYDCAYCGAKTTNGPDLARGIKACCGRWSCCEKSWDETEH